jgi:Glutathione S-transferase, N-terminal domain
MIRVHHLNNSRSQRVLWLLEELNLPYEIVRYQRDKLTMLAPEALKQVHPLGKSPGDRRRWPHARGDRADRRISRRPAWS